MKISRLRRGNANFPEKKEIGDATMLAAGDIFCWDGAIWQLVGGRYISERRREDFLQYISTGWPDPESARFDLPPLFDLDMFSDDSDVPEFKKEKTWIERFVSRVIEVSETIEKAG
jgi:hypothetical protein